MTMSLLLQPGKEDRYLNLLAFQVVVLLSMAKAHQERKGNTRLLSTCVSMCGHVCSPGASSPHGSVMVPKICAGQA